MTNVAMMSMEIYEASAPSQIYARHGEIWLDICSRTCFLTARVVMRRRNMVAWLSSAAASLRTLPVDFRGHTLPRLKAVFVVVKVVVLEVERSTCSRRALNALRIIAAQGVCRSGLVSQQCVSAVSGRWKASCASWLLRRALGTDATDAQVRYMSKLSGQKFQVGPIAQWSEWR